jgi:hypothetical protein
MSFNANVSSVQDVVRGGEKLDIYYYSKQNLFTQMRKTIRNTKYFQNLNSPNSGSSQVIFSSNQGLSDIIVIFKLFQQGSNNCDYTNYALNRGWGYSLIQQAKIRYGGSSQYTWSGSQMLMQNITEMNDSTSRDTLFSYGGDALMGTNNLNGGTNDFSGSAPVAYCYLNFPHNSPNGGGEGIKMQPLPTELLSSPVTIDIVLNNSNSIFSCNGAATTPYFPAQCVDTATIQFVQVQMVDSAQLLTNEENRNELTYVYPLKYFGNQEVSTVLQAQVNNNVNLTGFRNGEVVSLLIWLTNDNDSNSVSVPRLFNDNNWYAPINSQVSINGEIYDQQIEQSGKLLNLCNNKLASELAMTRYTLDVNDLTPVVGGFTGSYLKVDFAQHSDPVTNNLLVGGKSITNSIINFKCDTPNINGAVWRLHWLACFNSSLVFSGGNCEYSF